MNHDAAALFEIVSDKSQQRRQYSSHTFFNDATRESKPPTQQDTNNRSAPLYS